MSIATIIDMIADARNEIVGLKEKIEVAKERQQARLSRIRRDIEELDKAAESDDRGRTERDYVLHLNETVETINILGFKFYAGDVLKDVDPVIFDECYKNWYDAQPSPDPDYGDLLDEQDAAEEAVSSCYEATDFLDTALSELGNAEESTEEARHVLEQLDEYTG